MRIIDCMYITKLEFKVPHTLYRIILCINNFNAPKNVLQIVFISN